MKDYEVIKIREHAKLLEKSVDWFHKTWGVPRQAYSESMTKCLQNESPVPQWYVILDGEEIMAGIGVIENDFHTREDLTPNVCAVYVEEPYRNRGIAGKMLQFVCDDLSNMGINTLYLVTDHTSFYERYGWEYFCMVSSTAEPVMTRMYKHE